MNLRTSHVVVAGASLAGLRAAETLRAEGFTGRLSMVGEEVHPPYDRPPLSKAFIAGSSAAEELALAEFVDLGAHWHLGRTAAELDIASRSVVLDDGLVLEFDGLIIATGSRARVPPQWMGLRGVHALRSLDDALRLRDALHDRPRHLAVLGAGFIGSEVAATARNLGLEVTLVDSASLPLEAAVGPDVATHCADLHHRHGVHLRLGAGVDRLDSDASDLVGIFSMT